MSKVHIYCIYGTKKKLAKFWKFIPSEDFQKHKLVTIRFQETQCQTLKFNEDIKRIFLIHTLLWFFHFLRIG